jgi:hypothetical protein
MVDDGAVMGLRQERMVDHEVGHLRSESLSCVFVVTEVLYRVPSAA